MTKHPIGLFDTKPGCSFFTRKTTLRRLTQYAILAIPFLLMIDAASLVFADHARSIAGVWEGAIEGSQKLRVVLHMRSRSDSVFAASVDVPELGRWGWPAANAHLVGRNVTFDIPSWNRLHFAGVLEPGNLAISGVVIRADGVSRRLTLQYQGAESASASAVDGDWFGLLRSPNYRTLRLRLHVRTAAPGAVRVAFDDVDRANMGVPCENVKFDAGRLSFEIPAWHANYAARLNANGSTLDGVWAQWNSLPLRFVRQSLQEELAAGIPAPAMAPLSLVRLKVVLDREFAPLIANGLLAKAAGGGVVIGVLDHRQRRIFSYGAARPDSIFEIGSITKTFTGLALAQMVEQRRVTLDEPVRELLPAGVIPKSQAEITLVDLATHHSGLPRLPHNLGLETGSSNLFADYDIEKLQAFFANYRARQRPDAKFEYSNFGFGVLGYALAKRAGCSYEQLVKTEVTDPLKLKDTVVTLSAEQEGRLIQGYNSALDPTDAGAWDYPFFVGAASLRSTATDMLEYLNANMHPHELSRYGPKGSPAASLPAAIALDHVLRADAWPGARVAMDWIYDERLQYFGHGGGTTSYSSWVQFSPKQNRAIVVLYNRLDDTPGQDRLVDRIAENIDDLMSGRPSRPIDRYPESDRALVAAAIPRSAASERISMGTGAPTKTETRPSQ